MQEEQCRKRKFGKRRIIIKIIIISILYFNVLTQQLQEPITESAQGNNKCTKIPMHNQILA
jgi:hypothetical protein